LLLNEARLNRWHLDGHEKLLKAGGLQKLLWMDLCLRRSAVLGVTRPRPLASNNWAILKLS
jgi:hypothetical protein